MAAKMFLKLIKKKAHNIFFYYSNHTQKVFTPNSFVGLTLRYIHLKLK